MPYNQQLLEQLKSMLSWKKSRKFYAERLGITELEVESLIIQLRASEEVQKDAETANYITTLEDAVMRFEEDLIKGTGEITYKSDEEIKTLDELIEKCRIDTEKWDITKYIQNYWGNSETPYWQVKAWLSKKKDHQLFQDAFVKFLETYKPISQEVIEPKIVIDKSNGCLLINKQDSHLNKLDVYGSNDMDERFGNILYKMELVINQAALSNDLDNIIYVIGSDEFNSEFTNTTTKGTPQQNIGSYHDSFHRICEHEVLMITLLLKSARNVDVVYVAGNHDEYVGWHMINWLSTYFRNEERVSFDCSPRYRKYISYGDSAIMLNHGDAIKPAKLAAIFPMEYRDEWSYHSNFYIFTGDKHHEISQDFNGIKFYQIPAFSSARSGWDDKNGYTLNRGEVTGFLIDFNDGLTNIFKQYL